MTTDVTSLTGITRVQSNSNTINQVTSNVVPIKGAVSPEQPDNKQLNAKDIEKAVSQVNKFIQQIGRDLEFSVDDASGRVVITVREHETGKIIRQIPPEELLVIAKLVRENFTNSAPSGILLADEG